MTGRAPTAGFFKHRYEKQDEVQRACAGARRRHGRAFRGNVLCDTNFTALRAESSSRPPHTIVTHAEKEEQCVSVQEHVWGTDGLAKLEAIKDKIDPQGLFQCQKCVGFKGPVRDQ